MNDTYVYLYDDDKCDIEISSDDCWESTDDLKNITGHAHIYRKAI